LEAFVVDDIESIFEEHRICSNINLCHILQTVQDKGVYISDEKKFIFTNVLVGHRATARFKIRNVNKVPCDVVLSIKPIPGKVREQETMASVAFQGLCGSSSCSPDSLLPLAQTSPGQCRSNFRGEQQWWGASWVEFRVFQARFWLSPLGLWWET